MKSETCGCVRRGRRVGGARTIGGGDAHWVFIAAQFTKFDIKPSRGAYMIVDRRTSNPIARLRPIPDTDRFELFYWSNVKGRWTTFGNMGRMKLMLKSAHEIVENEPIFRVSRPR